MRARTVGLVCSRELRAKTPAFVTAATPLQRGGLNSLWIKLGILLGKTISPILARAYVSGSNGYRFMLSIPYGSEQCGVLQALKLGVCFPAREFKPHRNEASQFATPFGAIPALRLFTNGGPRQESATY